MVADVNIQVRDHGISKALTRLIVNLPLGGDSTPAMRGIGRVLKTAAQLRFREQRGPDGRQWKESRRARTEGGQTLRDTSRLRNSLSFEASRDRVEVGTNVIYAAIHQFGGVIRPKSAKFLSVPMTPQARQAGSPRKFGRELAVAQTLRGQWVMVDPKTGTVHYLLMKSVTIPARPYLGASEADRDEIIGVLEDHYLRLWK